MENGNSEKNLYLQQLCMQKRITQTKQVVFLSHPVKE